MITNITKEKRREYRKRYKEKDPERWKRQQAEQKERRRKLYPEKYNKRQNKKPQSMRERRWADRGIRITLSEYEQKLILQNHKCAICDKPESQLKRKLAVDHDHRTNQIRGLLCSRCNIFLAAIEDPVLKPLLENYLNSWKINPQR